MSDKIIKPARNLKGEVHIPGDKSISHRAVMFGALAKGTTRVTGFLDSADCRSTIRCFRQLGVEIETPAAQNDAKEGAADGVLLIHGRGLHGLSPQAASATENDSFSSDGAVLLDTGNSGTTTRLISGILAGQAFPSVLSGDESLNMRPMKRITEPLTEMGADITSLNGNGCAPLEIRPVKSLHGISYQSPVASAQVKSALLLAGLYADGETSVTEPALSRNHTELMLRSFGADINSKVHADGTATASVWPCRELYAQEIAVPGDISSAAYFLAAALLVPGSELLVKNVGINPTRAGFLKVCEDMGANLTLENERTQGGEPQADIRVKTSALKGTVIEGSLIPALIDELPMIAVMAAFADGTTIIRDAAELKVKESDRIATTTAGLTAMGAEVTPTDDGMIIRGGWPLHGADIRTEKDHRIAMSFAIAGLTADGETRIRDSECVDISYPAFFETLAQLER